MGKRIVLTSLGSFGDLHPFLAVAIAFKARGFEPIIAGSETYRRKVVAEGIGFHPVAPSSEQLQSDTGLSEGEILQRLTARFIIDNAMTPYLDRSFEDLCEAMRGASVVIACNFSIVARIAAAKLGLPVVTLLLAPCAFFSAAEPPYLLEAPWLSDFRRRFGVRATMLVMYLRRLKSRWQTRRITAFRRSLGLPGSSRYELLAGPLRTDKIYALYSPQLGRLPSDAPANCVLAGYTFYDSHEGGQVELAPGVEAFLKAGPPPLVFTLGSTGVFAPRDFYQNAVATARRLGMRAILLVGSKADASLAQLASDDVLVANYVPHSLIFPRAAANIHHGGVGTAGQAMRAGRVQLVCPMVGDQGDNAERLVRLGVARRLNHKDFTIDRAEAALRELLSDKTAIARAASLGALVAHEDGAAVAADGIAAMLAQRSKPPVAKIRELSVTAPSRLLGA